MKQRAVDHTVRICLLTIVMASARGAAAAEIRVPPNGDLQAALNAAKGGDTILLTPGATYTGNFRLPRHDGGLITVRSAASDTVLPPAGVRIGPTYAQHLPKIKSPNTQPALSTAAGASFWRLLFLEFPSTTRGAFDIITLGDGSEAQRTLEQVPQELILDRVYVHGDPLHGQKRGIAINGGKTTIINSHVSDIKAIGQDSQAVGGWNGPGPFILENNYLEAAGEVFQLGGSDPAIPNLVPTDVLLRGNTLTRPLAWRQAIMAAPAKLRTTITGQGRIPAGRHVYRVVARRPAYDTTASSSPSAEAAVVTTDGASVTLAWDAVPDASEYRLYRRGPQGDERYWSVASPTFIDDGSRPGTTGEPEAPTVWQVKNLLELKNARRVRIERNTLTNNWAQAQIGVAVLFTPRNQDGNCPWCVVEDVVFEYNTVRGVGAGINILGYDDLKPSQQTRGLVIRHNRFIDVSKSWGGTGYFMYVQGRPRDITVDHNTIISPDGAGILAVDGPPVIGFRFTNNLALHNDYGVIGTNNGPGLNSIKVFFPGGVFTRNVLAGCDAAYYPPDNECPTAADFRGQFVSYAEGDYRLTPKSRWLRAATDGTALGATFPALDSQATAPRPEP